MCGAPGAAGQATDDVGTGWSDYPLTGRGVIYTRTRASFCSTRPK